MRKKKRKGRIALIAALAVLALLVAGALLLTSGLAEGAKAQLNGVDLQNKPDGEYIGAYNFGRWTNTLAVQVKDHRITGIDIRRDVMARIPNCSDEIFRRVIEAQDTKVDAVSGATVTSKAYLKAIENALS